MAMHEIAVADVATAKGKHIEFDHGNVTLKGLLVDVTNSELVLDNGLNPGYVLHLDRRLIRGDVVKLLSE